MTTHDDLKQRLRQIAEPAVAPASHKERLRSKLMRRRARRRVNRPLVTVIAVVLVFSATLLQETPLESVNNSLPFSERVDNRVDFRAHEESRSGLGYGRSEVVDGVAKEVRLSDDEVEEVRSQQEQFTSLHAAGQTRLWMITGVKIDGRRMLSASYVAMIDSARVTRGFPIDDLTKSAEFQELFSTFLNERRSGYFRAHHKGQLQPLPPEEVVVDGQSWTVERSIVDDEVFGEMEIWNSFY